MGTNTAVYIAGINLWVSVRHGFVPGIASEL